MLGHPSLKKGRAIVEGRAIVGLRQQALALHLFLPQSRIVLTTCFAQPKHIKQL